MSKSTRGNFFEDFHPGQVIRHATPRTLGEGDASLYVALTGDRRPLHCSRTFAQAFGLPREPVNDLLLFHTVFGKTVGDVSLNAVANLGYADVRFLRPVYAGDTLSAETEVLGVKETSSGKTGVVWVRTRGLDEHGAEVLRFCRWVMVEKRDPASPAPTPSAPTLPTAVPAAELIAPFDASRFAEVAWQTGARASLADYAVGERIDHLDGMTLDEVDHTAATRLYQNTARVHFNLHAMAASRFGRRLVYGGHVISVAWALAMNGLEPCLGMLAWNSGQHTNPTFAGDTLYAWTEVVDKAPLGDHAVALRIRLRAAKNVDPSREPVPEGNQVLDLDLWIWGSR